MIRATKFLHVTADFVEVDLVVLIIGGVVVLIIVVDGDPKV